MSKKEFKNDKELRMMEFRADEQEGKMILEGYPVVFNQETMIGDEEWGWKESIDSHALDETDMSDCCLKYNHGDSKGILARVKNGSLNLTIDSYGLKMRAELIDTTDNVDIYKCVKSGLLDKMSFAFNVLEENYDWESKPNKRTITKIGRLFDCSVVDLPAYDQTSIYARSKELVEANRCKAEADSAKPLVETNETSLNDDNSDMEIEDETSNNGGEQRNKELELRKRKFKFKMKEEK